MADQYVYPLGKAQYINLTNRCTNRCGFCLRSSHDGVGDSSLWLTREPTADEVMAALPESPSEASEFVFCGFGEPMMALPVLLAVAHRLRERCPGVPIRINTNGQGNLFWGRDTAMDLPGAVDRISVSLNADSAEEYDRLCSSQYGPAAFDAVLGFARRCVALGLDTTLTVLSNLPEERITRCRKIADGIGAKLRVRAYIP